jgi:hypothetical protein
MSHIEFVDKVKDIANNYKTLYIMGCFGAPMTPANKKRYCKNHSYNTKPKRVAMIEDASADTFGFDCVCLIKGILWGWNGLTNKTYGGAKYASNGVPDIDAGQMINKCSDLSTDFSNIEIGEAVWIKGHIGVYVGDGLAVECTPAWANGVQFTACNRDVNGYKRRNWTKHGKLPYIEYVKVEEEKEEKAEDTKTKSLKTFIRNIQSAIGAKVDGIAGPETLSKTVTVSARYNKRHAVVKHIQKRLYELGYVEVGVADGVAGPKFTSAVAHFQQDNGCVVDGVITKKNKTWKKLLGMA